MAATTGGCTKASIPGNHKWSWTGVNRSKPKHPTT